MLVFGSYYAFYFVDWWEGGRVGGVLGSVLEPRWHGVAAGGGKGRPTQYIVVGTGTILKPADGIVAEKDVGSLSLPPPFLLHLNFCNQSPLLFFPWSFASLRSCLWKRVELGYNER